MKSNILRLIAHKTLPPGLLECFIGGIRSFKRKRRDALIIENNNKAIQKILQNGNTIKLELGAGGRKMDGWTTIDFDKNSDIIMDLTSPVPFPDNTVTQIYASHLLEHFYYPELLNLIYECYRILNPGGIFKVAVPNARIYLEAYLYPGEFDANRYCCYEPAFRYNSRIDFVNYMAYMGGHHKYLFDEENLPLILSKAGFKNVRLREFDPALDLEERLYESIYAEAEK